MVSVTLKGTHRRHEEVVYNPFFLLLLFHITTQFDILSLDSAKKFDLLFDFILFFYQNFRGFEFNFFLFISVMFKLLSLADWILIKVPHRLVHIEAR